MKSFNKNQMLLVKGIVKVVFQTKRSLKVVEQLQETEWQNNNVFTIF